GPPGSTRAALPSSTIQPGTQTGEGPAGGPSGARRQPPCGTPATSGSPCEAHSSALAAPPLPLGLLPRRPRQVPTPRLPPELARRVTWYCTPSVHQLYPSRCGRRYGVAKQVALGSLSALEKE